MTTYDVERQVADPTDLNAEASLRLDDHRRLLVDNTDSGLVLFDAEGVVISANPSAERLLGLGLGEMRGRASTDPRWATVDEHGDPLAPADDPVTTVLATGSSVRRATLGVYRPTEDGDGSVVWLEVSCEPLYRSVDERPFAVVSSLRDATQRRKTELELRDSELRYRLLADNSSDVITRISRTGVISWVSPSVRRLLGYSPQGLVGAPLAALIHPEDVAVALSAFRSLFRSAPDDDVVVRIRVRRRGGAYIHVEVAMRAVRSSHGFITEIQSSARDVSSRVDAETARRSAEGVFRLALEHAPIGMALIGLDSRWMTVNNALLRIAGHPRADFERLTLLQLIHDDDRDVLAEAMTAMTDGGMQTAESDVRMVTSTGTYVWVEQSMTLVTGPDGAPSYFVLQVVDISDRMRTQEDLARRAVTDPLTGLANRLVLEERLERALVRSRRDSTQVGLVFVDLDHFKTLNDRYGHDAGDEVLRQVAMRLTYAVRDKDTAIRLGGDEFVVLCEENAGPGDLRTLADRLFRDLSRPYELGWGPVTVSCSIGLTAGSGPDAASLVHQADAAMYHAKRLGRAQISIFEGAMRSSLEDGTLEKELAVAVDDGSLRVCYQPVLRLGDGVSTAREALLRWQHPERGLLEPDEVAVAAQQSRLIADLDEWTLTRACRDAAEWSDRAAVWVTISPRWLARSDLARVVAASLTSAGLPPERLQIGVREKAIVESPTATLSALREVADLGTTLALCEFGSSYGSLAALQRLPITSLKLDRRLVRSLPHVKDVCFIVSALLRMCAGMGITVVAEGVETPAQATWLLEQGCPLGQGSFFAASAPRTDAAPGTYAPGHSATAKRGVPAPR